MAMGKGKKIIFVILGILVLLIVAAAVAIPLLVNVDRYRSEVVQELQEVTGKPVAIGHLGLTVFPRVAIDVDDLDIGNPTGFPKGHFLKAQRISATVDARALLDHRVVIERLNVEKPEIALLEDARGRWNFENLSAAGGPAKKPAANRPAKGSASDSGSFTLGVIAEVVVNKLELSAANLLESGHPGPAYFQGHNVSAKLENLDLLGFAGSSTSASLGPAFAPQTGLLFAATRGPAPAGQGTLTAGSLHFGNLEATSVDTKIRLYTKLVNLDGLKFDLYDGRAAGDFSFNFAGTNPHYSVTAKINGLDVRKLLEAFPNDRGKMTGTMDGNIKLAGEIEHSADPLAGMRGTGEVQIKNGSMPSLQLNKNLLNLAKVGGLGAASGDPSSFSSASADLNIANGQISSNKITVVGNGVNADGSGSMALAGAGKLDYQGVAKLDSKNAGVSNLLGALAGAQMSNGQLSFPFTLAGTLDNPAFSLKSGGAATRLGGIQNLVQGQTGAGGAQSQPSNPIGAISGLFKKKK